MLILVKSTLNQTGNATTGRNQVNTVRLKFKEYRSIRNIIWSCTGDIQISAYQKTKSHVEE